MANKGHPSDPIFEQCKDVSKDALSVDDLLPLVKAIQKVSHHSIQIGRALGLTQQRLSKIKKHKDDRRAIAVMDSWLRGNINKTIGPYSLHSEEKYKCPSWWNLVWAVAHTVGGDNPAHALFIAQHYKEWYTSSDPEYDFSDVDTTAFTDADVQEVNVVLKKVWSRWYEIGVALKLPTSDLDNIQDDESTNEERSRVMIENWRNHNVATSCWRRLVIAIAVPHGGDHVALAEDLAKKHGSRSDDETEPEATKIRKVSDDGLFKKCSEKVERVFLPYTINNKKEKKHGLALIIVNEKFRKHPDHPEEEALSKRDCADRDLDKLRDLWEFLGYRVRCETDKTAEEIEGLFNEVREDGDPGMTIQEGDDSFACCISSHGTWDPALGTDVVWGVDGIWFEEDDRVVVKGALDIKNLAYRKLSPLEDGCPKLKERPKMFFMQACRGKHHGKIADDGTMGTGKVFAAPKRLPRETDFLFAYATAPGNKAYRNPSNGDPDLPFGSFFVSYLSRYLKGYAPQLPLLPILEAVSQQQALELPYKVDGGVITRQSPNLSSSLRGPVFFFDEAREQYKKSTLSLLSPKHLPSVSS